MIILISLFKQEELANIGLLDSAFIHLIVPFGVQILNVLIAGHYRNEITLRGISQSADMVKVYFVEKFIPQHG